MSRTIRGALLLCALFLGLPQALQAQPMAIDRVAAIVDENVILSSELEERVLVVLENARERNLPLPPEAQLRREVLDQLILENLQLQMARRAGVRVDDNMLNTAMENIAAQNNMSFEQFRQILEANGIYLQTREQLAREITLGQFQQRAVNQRIDITRQEIENYLRSEAGQSAIAPEYRVAHILIPAAENPAEAGRRNELAAFLHQQLEAGANILAIVNEGSIAGIPISGGDLGWHKVETLPSVFRPVVPDLQPGQVTDPFSSSSGQHIVALLEKRGGVNLSVQQTHLRHILIQPNEIRTEEQARTLIHQLYERILAGEDFAAIARQHTNDANSMVAGGDLDWVSEGQLPEDFMAVVRGTDIGEMTEPFRVQTGWHIIEVLDRREQDVTEENKRFRAQQVLRERKYEMELQNWLTEIRDTAFVEIKEENL